MTAPAHALTCPLSSFMRASPIVACGTRNGRHSPLYAMLAGWTFVDSVSPLNARTGHLFQYDVLDTLAAPA